MLDKGYIYYKEIRRQNTYSGIVGTMSLYLLFHLLKNELLFIHNIFFITFPLFGVVNELRSPKRGNRLAI